MRSQKKCPQCGENNLDVQTYCHFCYASFENKNASITDEEKIFSRAGKPRKLVLRIKSRSHWTDIVFRGITLVAFACLTFYTFLFVASKHMRVYNGMFIWDYSQTVAQGAFVFCGFVVLGLILYNFLIRDMNRTLKNWSQIDVYLKKRRELIPKLVGSVNQFMQHEKKVLDEIVKIRSLAHQPRGIQEQGEIEKDLGYRIKVLV